MFFIYVLIKKGQFLQMEKICKNGKHVFENRASDYCSFYCGEQYFEKQSQILN